MDHITRQWQGPKSGSSSLSPGLRGACVKIQFQDLDFHIRYFFFLTILAQKHWMHRPVKRKNGGSERLQQLFLSLFCWLNCLCSCVKCCSSKRNAPNAKVSRVQFCWYREKHPRHPVLPVKTKRHFLPQSCLITSIMPQSTANTAINILCQLFQNAPVFSWMFRQPWNAI